MDEKFNGLAGLVEDINKGEKSKEYAEIIKFLQRNVAEYDNEKKKKILTALKSFPQMKLKIKFFNFDS